MTVAVPGGTLSLRRRRITSFAWPRGGLPTFDNIGEIEITRNLGTVACQFHFQADTLSMVLTPPSGTKWAPAGSDFNDARQDLIDGIGSTESHTNGFADLIQPSISVSNVVRTHDTRVTITLPTSASYAPTYPGERYYCTIPNDILRTTGDAAVPAGETFGCNRRAELTGTFPTGDIVTNPDPMILFGRDKPLVAVSFAAFGTSGSLTQCGGGSISLTARYARIRVGVMVLGYDNESLIPNPLKLRLPIDEEPYVKETGASVYRPASDLATLEIYDGCTTSGQYEDDGNGWYTNSRVDNTDLFGTDTTEKRWELYRSFDSEWVENIDHNGWSGGAVEVSTPTNGGGVYVNTHSDTPMTDQILAFREV